MFLILCSLLGAAVVMLISHLNSQIDERTLGSYTTPFMIGLISGALVGFLQNRLFHQQQAREELFIDLIEVMAVTLEERDQYTHGHAHRVTQLARMLGKSAKLDEAQLNNLRLASILHDIGKIGIPDEVLLKQAPLSEDEFTIIKSHPDKGARILGKLRDARMEPIVLAVGHHHERYDGQGYPDGLCCHEIPLLARIIAIADSFDAMTSDRPYRKGMPTATALAEIERCADSQFDPVFAALFVQMFAEGTIQR